VIKALPRFWDSLPALCGNPKVPVSDARAGYYRRLSRGTQAGRHWI
jgi:hypothetical protein